MLGIREIQIIQELLKGDVVYSKDLAAALGISLRQLSYSLAKINQELNDNDYKTIKRDIKGKWKIEKDSLNWLVSKTSPRIEIRPGTNEYDEKYEEIIDSDYRFLFEIIFILVYPGTVRVQNIQDYMHVSRNTILADLKQVQTSLKGMKLFLKYTSLHGYSIVGNDKEIKRAIVRIISILMKGKVQIKFLDPLVKRMRDQIIHLISLSEKELKLKYSDTSFLILYYSLALSAMYIAKKNEIKMERSSVLENTIEHKFLLESLPKLKIPYRNTEDIEWYCQLFLSSNTIQNTVSSYDKELYMAIRELISIFEQKTSIHIKKPEFLAKRLFAHLRPAVYRIKFNIPIDNINIDSIDLQTVEYKTIFGILKDCVQPIENIVGKRLPLDEIKLISFYFGGELLNQVPKITSKKRAIVVCSNGLIVAKLMLKTLTDIFPELIFLTTASAREFAEYESDYDVVFTTVPLNTTALQYIVPPLLSEDDQVHLRIKVLRDLMLEDIHKETTEIINIIKKYTKLNKETAIRNEISSYLADLKITDAAITKTSAPKEYLPLSFYLKEKYITLSKQKFRDWQEALLTTCKPLLEDHVITEDYVNKLIEQLSDSNSYFFLNEKIAIPHSLPEDGVNQEACALLVSQHPIVFPGDHEVNFIVPFALLNSDRHLYALNQLISFSENSSVQEALLEAATNREVFRIIEGIQSDQRF